MKNENNNHVHEPLMRVSKRINIAPYKALLIRLGAIVIALLFCSVLATVILDGATPLKFFSTMWKGSFGTKRKIWKLLKDIAILLCISLAVTPAFRMKFWNIGAEGQVLVGCLASVACVFYLGGKIPEYLLLIIMFFASVIASAIWAFIPAFFKAKWNTNETLFTLMMNYVATYLVAYALIKWVPNGSSSLPRLEYGKLPKLGNDYLILIITVILLTAFLYVYLNYSKQGYEISVVGESQKTARYIGINVQKVIICTMIVSGVLCGIAGFLIVSALDNTVTTESVGGRGFTAIMVSWLAKFDPIFMIFTSFLLVFLQQGAAQISQNFNVSSAFPSIITGIILFFIIGCEFFINYQIHFRKNSKVHSIKEETK